jgi:hypothetical protein
MRKKFFGMVDHYVIYMGIQDGHHRFVANYTKGVRILPDEELQGFLKILQPKHIDPFPGAESERPAALRRARQLIGQKAYDFVANNCEHFKNWVHHAKFSSDQVDATADGLILGGLGVAAVGGVAKKGNAVAAGLGITALGIILKAIESGNRKK